MCTDTQDGHMSGKQSTDPQRGKQLATCGYLATPRECFTMDEMDSNDRMISIDFNGKTHHFSFHQDFIELMLGGEAGTFCSLFQVAWPT